MTEGRMLLLIKDKAFAKTFILRYLPFWLVIQANWYFLCSCSYRKVCSNLIFSLKNYFYKIFIIRLQNYTSFESATRSYNTDKIICCNFILGTLPQIENDGDNLLPHWTLFFSKICYFIILGLLPQNIQACQYQIYISFESAT